MNPCFATLAVGVRYQPYLERLRTTLEKFRPGTVLSAWADQWPPESPTHVDKNYAFKYYAVRHAQKQGYNPVIWLDASCYVTADPTPLIEETMKRSALMVANSGTYGSGGEMLGEWISDAALKFYGMDREEAMTIHLCGGAIIGVDSSSEAGLKFMQAWYELVQTDLTMCNHSVWRPDRMRSVMCIDPEGQKIISEDPRVKGHRSDEACLSIVLRHLGIKTITLGEFHQCIDTGYNL